MSNILKLNDTISSGSLFEHATQQQMRQEDYSLSRDKTGYWNWINTECIEVSICHYFKGWWPIKSK